MSRLLVKCGYFMLATIASLLIIALFQGISNQTPDVPPIVVPVPSPPAPPPAPKTEPGDNFPWIDYQPKQNETDKRWGAVLTEIQQHLDPSHGNTYYSKDNITHAHETTHGINADVRNNLGKNGQNGFYCLNNQAALLTDPKCRLSQIGKNVPQSLRGTRFNLYLVQQTRYWDDVPTYVLDEWIAYINGISAGVDQINRGLYEERPGETSDVAIGPMEFTYYALALCCTIKEHDPDYFKNHPEFAEFVAFNIRRSVKVYKEGICLRPFRWSTEIVDSFITNDEAQPLRVIASELWGDEFVKKYLMVR